jgi:hypothetical protein
MVNFIYIWLKIKSSEHSDELPVSMKVRYFDLMSELPSTECFQVRFQTSQNVVICLIYWVTSWQGYLFAKHVFHIFVVHFTSLKYVLFLN